MTDFPWSLLPPPPTKEEEAECFLPFLDCAVTGMGVPGMLCIGVGAGPPDVATDVTEGHVVTNTACDVIRSRMYTPRSGRV